MMYILRTKKAFFGSEHAEKIIAKEIIEADNSGEPIPGTEIAATPDVVACLQAAGQLTEKGPTFTRVKIDWTEIASETWRKKVGALLKAVFEKAEEKIHG